MVIIWRYEFFLPGVRDHTVEIYVISRSYHFLNRHPWRHNGICFVLVASINRMPSGSNWLELVPHASAESFQSIFNASLDLLVTLTERSVHSFFPNVVVHENDAVTE